MQTVRREILSSALQFPIGRKDQEERIGLCTSKKDPTDRPHGQAGQFEVWSFSGLLDTWVRQVAEAKPPEKLPSQKLFMPKTGGSFLITEKNCPPLTEHNDFENPRGINPGYFVIVHWSEV